MSGAHFRIDQAANPIPTGTTDTARDNIWQDRPLLLVATDTVTGTPTWTLVSGPLGASLVLSGSTTNTAMLASPKLGSYLCQYLVGDGLGVNKKNFVIRVTRDTNGLLIDDGQVDPAFGEESDADNSGGNARGWDARTSALYSRVTPAVDTMAALILRMGSKQRHVHLLGYYAPGDGGGGMFRWDATSTATHDDGLTIQPGFGTGAALATGRWIRIYVGVLQDGWFGVRADGRRITDLVCTAGSAVVTSATANFTVADVGKSFIGSIVSHLASGTISGTINQLSMTGTGTNLPVDLPITGGGTGTGIPVCGTIYSNGYYIAVQYSTGAANGLVLPLPLPVTITTQPFYVETQLACTIVGFTNATTVTLSATATINQSGVPAFIGSDDTACTDAFIRAVFATTHFGQLRNGLRGHNALAGANLNYIALDRLYLIGGGPQNCCFVDLRRVSTEYPYPLANFNYGGWLNFKDCSEINLTGLGYDGSVPMFAVNHSEGGTSNAGGGRGGVRLRNCPNSGIINCGSQGYASRDEFIATEVSTNLLIDRCLAPLTNNASINVAGGGQGCRITNNVVMGILAKGDSLIVAHNIVGPAPAGVGCGITVDCQGHTQVVYNHVEGGYSYANGAIDIFGTNDPTATLLVAGNTIRAMHGQYYTGAGVITLNNFGGHATVVHNTFKANIAFAGGGRNIYVAGASTGTIMIGPNVHGGSDANILIGLHVDATVPAGSVIDLPGSFYDIGLTTRVNIQNIGLGSPIEMGTA